MLHRKNLVVVGLTTFNTEMLKISVPALARIKSAFALIIHNDNPNKKITRRDIRKLGYRGTLQIINSTENVGLRMARVRILDMAQRVAARAKWIIYMCDDDILLSTDIPTVSENVFAIIQNSLIVRRRVSDLIIGADHPESIAADGDNVVLQRPWVGLSGTAVRIDVLQGFVNLMHTFRAQLDEFETRLRFRIPTDIITWNALNAYAHHTNPTLTPIYMDSVNCIRNGIDTKAHKYGLPTPSTQNVARTVARYDALFAYIFAQC